MWIQLQQMRSPGPVSGFQMLFCEGVEPQVCLGQTMIAGETIIANLTSSAPQTMGESR